MMCDHHHVMPRRISPSAGLAATSVDVEAGEGYELPTFDPGRALIADPAALKDLLDAEDDERAVRHRA